MSAVGQGRALNKYCLSLKRKKSFLPRASAILREDQRIGKKIKPRPGQPRRDAYKLRRARQTEMYLQGRIIVSLVLCFVFVVAYGVYWLMG